MPSSPAPRLLNHQRSLNLPPLAGMSTESRLGVVFTMGAVFTVSAPDPPVSLCSAAPASGGVWSSGAKNEKGRSRWNGIGLRGADGNRNHDLFDANEALYQLSYSPLDVALLRRTTQYTLIRPMSKCKPACVKIGCRLWADMRHCAWGASLGEPSPSDATERNQAGRAPTGVAGRVTCSACRPPHSMSSPRYRASCRISP